MLAGAATSEVSQPAPVSRRFYQPELDCLRFFAFFAVYVHHTFSPDPLYYVARRVPFPNFVASMARAGSFGVDLFFLLSAYLITKLFLYEKEDFGSIHLKSFYLRRVLRIWPLYFFCIGIGILLSRLDESQPFPLGYMFAFLLLCGNWLTSLVGFPGSVMTPLWSVSFEEQFYLVWPIIASRIHRSKEWLFAGGAMLVLSQLARLLLLRYARHSEVAIFTNTFARLDPLALGAVTAVLLRRPLKMRRTIRAVCFLTGITVWLLAGHFFAMTSLFMLLGYPAIAFGAWLVFISVLGISAAPPWLRYLGKISYGLYALHMLSLHLVMRLMGSYPHNLAQYLGFWSAGLVCTFGLAALSYRFLEMPFLRLKDRYTFVQSRPA